MAEPCLDCPSVVALVGEGVSTGVAEQLRMRPELEAGTGAVRSIIQAKPAVANSDPRSLTKTKADVCFSRGSR
jgi:hypothetical protein